MPGPWGFSGPRGFLTDEEKQHMPKVTKELLLRILSYLKPYWLQFGLVFITILLSAAVGLLPSAIWDPEKLPLVRENLLSVCAAFLLGLFLGSRLRRLRLDKNS